MRTRVPSLRPVAAWLLATVVALFSVLVVPTSATASSPRKPTTPIKHFVFLFQADHSFDNYFGTRPGVDGTPPGTCMPVDPRSKQCVKPFHVGDRGVTGLVYERNTPRRQYNWGAMDSFVKAGTEFGADGRMSMGYYDDRDLPYYWNIADQYVLFDRFFSSSFRGGVVNHMYAVAGRPGVKPGQERIPEKGWGDIPTIFDRLDAAGVDWKFYVENYDPDVTFRTRHEVQNVDRAAQVVRAPVLAYARYIDNPRIRSRIVDMDQYYRDVADGTLPAVSYLVPSGASEHPPGRVQAGESLVRSLITELMRSRLWNSSAFFWTYDDAGGWYDHVRPPRVDRHSFGFRVPALLVSPYARRGYVDSTTSDHTSVLAFIEANWRLKPLSRWDRDANDMMGAFDFTRAPRKPLLLDRERTRTELQRPQPRPVYVGYVGAVALTAGLWRLATLRSRRPKRRKTAGGGS